MASLKDQIKTLEASNAEKDTQIAELKAQIEILEQEKQMAHIDKKLLVAKFLSAQLSAKPLPNSNTNNNPHLNEMIKVAEYLAEVV